MTASRKIAFQRIAEASLAASDVLVSRWLPDGRREGAEWVATNPTRTDKRRGSFKVNLAATSTTPRVDALAGHMPDTRTWSRLTV